MGDRPPLLWVEGGPGYPAALGLPDCEVVADLFRCHLVDAPGSGESTPPGDPADYDVAGHVAFFERVRAVLGIDSWTVVGHPWGGLVALAYAASCPSVVDRLIVVDGYAGEASVPEEAWKAESDRCHPARRLLVVRSGHWPIVGVGRRDNGGRNHGGYGPRYPLYFAYPDRPCNIHTSTGCNVQA